jgi:FtsH-binding integral membrane protein
MMRKIGAALLAVSLMSSSVALAATPTQGALAPGKAAGVKQAQLGSNLWLWAVAMGFIVGGALLVSASNSKGSAAGSTTGSP